MAMKLSTRSGFSAWADAVIIREKPRYRGARENETVLMGGMLYDRSLINLKAVSANLGNWDNVLYFDDDRMVKLDGMYCGKDENMGFTTTLTRIQNGYETIHQALVFRAATFNKVFLVENKDELYKEFYSYCMRAFTFPLMEKWMPFLFGEAVTQGYATNDVKILCKDDYIIKRNGRDVQLNSLDGYYVEISETWIEETITQGLQKRLISISEEYVDMPELFLTDMDAYFAMYGDSLVRRLKSTVKPYSELKGGVEEVLFCGNKRLWKQQGALVNGIASAFADEHLHSAIVNGGMGVGKSCICLAIIESVFVKSWLRAHPGKTVKDAYSDPNAINYRIPIMMPGHLVSKWKDEIEQNVPFAKVTICRELADFTKIKAAGKKRNGREFFVMSKDFAKLSCTERPAPVQVKSRKPVEWVCTNPECGKVHSFQTYLTINQCKCGADKSTFKRRPVESARDIRGLICPDCGEVLVDKNRDPLLPIAFSGKRTGNTRCNICGAGLWQPNVKNLGGGGKKKWYKISHFKNAKKQEKEIVWVLKGQEDSYTNCLQEFQRQSIEISKEMTVRKFAPAQYIKKQLKGYFDIAVFDELHVYKGGETAQGTAMHAIAKASKQVLGLTGTIAGGMANHLYYTLWRLAPEEMVKMGYHYEDEQKFVEMYGTLESSYELQTGRGRYNVCSKGRQLESPKVKPGISPVIFQDFLIDKTVFMDLSDMSRHLPKLNEQVVTCEMDEAMSSAYQKVIDNLLAAGARGFSSLSACMLQFSLAYPDKPFNTGPIIDPKNGNEVCTPASLPYEDVLFPKEKKLVEILEGELSEGRNAFIYCEYTGKENWRVVERVRQIIIDYCGLEEGEVAILESDKPSPDKREKWIHEKAAKGVRVFITNPKCVETGLDFIFNHNGKAYNFPTIIFMQMGMNLFTLWQASRRAYRLNQTEECRTYYLCYTGTNQAKMVRLMAEKQIATAAIQGHFSMEGLAAMSAAVDPRVQLMNNLLKAKEERSDDAAEATRMFGQLSEGTDIDEGIYGPSETKLYGEVFGEPAKLEVPTGDLFAIIENVIPVTETKETEKNETEEMIIPDVELFAVPEKKEEPETVQPVDDMFASFFSDTLFDFGGGTREETPSVAPAEEKRKRRCKKEMDKNQESIFNMFAQFN